MAPLRRNVVSGAAVVARTAAEVVRRSAVRVPASDAAELRRRLGELAVKILDAQPAMAPLVALGRETLASVRDVDDLDEARRAAAHAAETFRSRLESEALDVAAEASEVLPDGSVVLTLSSSSTVRAALVSAAADRDLHAVCLEGRPMMEGRSMARALADAGLRVTLAVDAATECLMHGVDRVLLGADSIGDAGVVNKIGSAAAVHAARRHDVPVYVIADPSKLLPPGFPQPLDDDRPPDEVWPGTSRARIWNRYFEAFPLELVTGVVTEGGILDAPEVEALRRELEVPPELRGWAEAWGGGPGAGRRDTGIRR